MLYVFVTVNKYQIGKYLYFDPINVLVSDVTQTTFTTHYSNVVHCHKGFGAVR